MAAMKNYFVNTFRAIEVGQWAKAIAAAQSGAAPRRARPRQKQRRQLRRLWKP